VSLSIVYAFNKKIMLAHDRLGRTAQSFKKYGSLLELLERQSFEPGLLRNLQDRLHLSANTASSQIAQLYRLLNTLDLRLNILVSVVLNFTTGFDLHTYLRLTNWKRKNRKAVPEWFEVLAEMETLISLSSYAALNSETASYPELTAGEMSFRAENMGHPLIPPDVRVNNSFRFEGKPGIIVITGANMAGKSTFLRTLAVNTILAMNGAPVCTSRFALSPSLIQTSIRIQDSLAGNESYFYAELLRLKEILEVVRNEAYTMVVLDEILRGTNSRDKQAGTIGLIRKLISLKAFVIVATHDLAIGELEKEFPGIVHNYCFEVELAENQLLFDYKLKEGISTRLNASFLMRETGIID